MEKAICRICGVEGTFTTIALHHAGDSANKLQLFDAVYCDNCGHGVFDLNEIQEAVKNFSSIG